MQVFRAKAMPAHLLTNVKHEVLHEVVEEEDEEAEQGSEDEQTTGQHWQLGATTNTQPPTSAAIKLKAGSAASLVFHTPSSAFHLTSQQSHMHAQVPSVSAAAATAFDSTPSISRDSNQSEMVIHEMPIDGRLPEVDFAGASSMGTSGVGTSGLGTGTAHATSNEGYSPAAQDIAEEVLSTADEESAVEGFMDSNARTDSIAARTALGSLMDSPVHTGSILGSGVGSGLGSAMNSTVGVQPMLPPHVARALSGSTSRMGSGVGSSMGRIDSSMQVSSSI